MRGLVLCTGWLMTGLMVGCSESSAPPAEAVEAPVVERDTRLTDAVNDSLDKAKAVEDAAVQRKAEMDARLEQLESGKAKDDQP